MSARFLPIFRAAPARPSLSSPSRVLLPPTQRSVSQTPCLRLKESITDPKPDEFERHKQDSLQKQKSGKGHWKPELASESEASVKADRMSPHEAGEAAMKRLQEQTKGHAEETSKHGTSMKDNM